MKILAVQDEIYDVIAAYFESGEVCWVNQKMPRPRSPYVTLRLENIRRRQHAVKHMDTETGYMTEYRETSASLVMDLYEGGLNDDGVIINTVLDDMESFVQYLESEAVTDMLDAKGIAIAVRDNSIQELTDMLNDAQFRYRARAVFDVRYQNHAVGPYGQNNVTAGASGGGKDEFTNADAEYFTAVEVTGELGGTHNG